MRQQRRRREHEHARRRAAPQQPRDERARLKRLPQSHVVRENPASAREAQAPHPPHAVALMIVQPRRERGVELEPRAAGRALQAQGFGRRFGSRVAAVDVAKGRGDGARHCEIETSFPRSTRESKRRGRRATRGRRGARRGGRRARVNRSRTRSTTRGRRRRGRAARARAILRTATATATASAS